MPFALQPLDTVVIVVAALLLFGPQRLPEIGRGMGKMLTEFRNGARDMTRGFSEEVTKPIDEPDHRIFPSPAGSQPVSSISQPVVAVP